MHLQARGGVLLAQYWLIIDERDVVELVLAGQAEKIAHGADRNKEPQIGAADAFLALQLQHADDLKANVVERDGVADGGASGKNVAPHHRAQYRHAAMLALILSVQPATGIHLDGADISIHRQNAEDLAVGAGVFADGANVVALKDGRDVADHVRIGLNGFVVAEGQMVRLRNRCAACSPAGNAAAVNEHDVLADGL